MQQYKNSQPSTNLCGDFNLNDHHLVCKRKPPQLKVFVLFSFFGGGGGGGVGANTRQKHTCIDHGILVHMYISNFTVYTIILKKHTIFL